VPVSCGVLLESKALRMCTGSPASALFSKRSYSFRAIRELGYVCWSVPLLATTLSAVYGRWIPANRGERHHSAMAWTCVSNNSSSAEADLSCSASSWKESEAESAFKLDGEAFCAMALRTEDVHRPLSRRWDAKRAILGGPRTMALALPNEAALRTRLRRKAALDAAATRGS
jgi:hypothetical protein